MNYYLYYMISNNIRAQLKKQAKMRFITKENKWQTSWMKLLNDGAILPDVCTNFVIREQAWMDNPVCLLPESAALIEQINKTNFEGQINSLHVDDNLFTIAIPKTVRFNKEVIQGIFVSLVSMETNSQIVDSFRKKFNVKIKSTTDKRPGDEQLSISYRDPTGIGYVTNTVWVSDLFSILNSRSIEEFDASTRLTDADVFSYSLSTNEMRTQFEVLKFVVGFIVYMSVHHNRVKVIDNIKMKNADKGALPLRLEIIKQMHQTGKKAPHYRNLRDSRYYKGDFKSWKRGSRWIPVNMQTKIVETK